MRAALRCARSLPAAAAPLRAALPAAASLREPALRPTGVRGIAFASKPLRFAYNTVPAQCSPGTKVPSVQLSKCPDPTGFDAQLYDLAALCAGKKVIVLGLPGAFTPCWSGKTIPGYKKKLNELKAKGVDLVMALAVNDAAVMRAWSTDLKCDGTMIEFYADHNCEMTAALGLVMEGQPWKLGNPRCKRFAMVIEDGVIKHTNICAGPDDPAGDNAPEGSFVDAVLKLL